MRGRMSTPRQLCRRSHTLKCTLYSFILAVEAAIIPFLTAPIECIACFFEKKRKTPNSLKVSR